MYHGPVNSHSLWMLYADGKFGSSNTGCNDIRVGFVDSEPSDGAARSELARGTVRRTAPSARGRRDRELYGLSKPGGNMSGTRLRVGIVGTGLVAQVMHLPHLQSLPDLYEIVALCDLSAQTAQTLARRYGVPHTFTDIGDMLDTVELDAALILTPYHYPQVMAALSAGVHVFVEKPMCVNLAEAADMVDAARRNGLIGQLGYHKPYDSGYETGAAMVRAMSAVRMATMYVAHGPNEPFLEHYEILRGNDADPDRVAATGRAMRQAQQQAIGEQPEHVARAYGGLLGSGCHQLSIMRGCLGRVEDVLSTEIWNGGRSIAATLKFERGVRCVFTAVFMPDIRLFDETFTACGDDSSTAIRFPSPFLKHAPTMVARRDMENGRYVEREITTDYREAFRNELIHFHRSVTTSTPPRTPLEHGAEDAATMIAIVRSCPDFVT